MSFRPLFMATSIKNVRRKAAVDKYGYHDIVDWFRVSLIHGYFAGIGMDFFFETREQADHFSVWSVYDPQQLLDLMQPSNEQFQVESVNREKWYGQMNPYTNKPDVSDAWMVDMRGSSSGNGGQRRIRLRYPNPYQAERFTVGKSYSPQDLLGTLPSLPSDIGDLIQVRADAAANALADAQAAQAAADQAQADIALASQAGAQDAATQAQLAQTEADAAGAQADLANNDAGEFARQLALAALALAQLYAIAAANAVAVPSQPPPPPPPSTTFLQSHQYSGFPANQLGYIYLTNYGRAVVDDWWVTNGGSAGGYFVGTSVNNAVTNNIVHYSSGTFTNPFNGEFAGVYDQNY